jgi:hypothetical protein
MEIGYLMLMFVAGSGGKDKRMSLMGLKTRNSVFSESLDIFSSRQKSDN